MNITDEIKQSFKYGSMLTKIIYINLAVFVIVRLVEVFYMLFNIGDASQFPLLMWLAVPADLGELLYKPWTIFTYMFLHHDFIHILFNLLWFYWFGKIFLQYLTEKQLLNVYILGGVFGALLYIVAFNLLPLFQPYLQSSIALGASAAVLAVVVSISFYVPNYTLNLMFIGPIKLKYIALISIAIDVLSIAGANSGGHIAHLGGALFGYIFISQYKSGKEFSLDFDKFFKSIAKLFKSKPKIKVTYKKPKTDMEYNAEKAKKQEDIDKILDKISKAGYESLTKEEKEILFNLGNKK
jgi:rhomboid family protein